MSSISISTFVLGARALIGLKEKYTLELQKLLTNEEIAVETRWNLFIEFHELLPIQTGFTCALFDKLNLHDDLSVDRYQTVTFKEIYDKITYCENFGYDYNYFNKRITQEDVYQFQLDVLNSGLQGFVEDW